MWPLAPALALALALAPPLPRALAQAQADCPPPYANSSSEPWLPRSDPPVAITAEPGADDLAGTSAVARWSLEYHNRFRAQFGALPLTWNRTLAEHEVEHTRSCVWEHLGNDNLAMAMTTEEGASFDANVGLDGWANEWRDHHGQKLFDHFTAMVWKEAGSVGCAWHLGCTTGSFAGWASTVYYTCRYAPVVNLDGEGTFAANVGTFGGCDAVRRVADAVQNGETAGAAAPASAAGTSAPSAGAAGAAQTTATTGTTSARLAATTSAANAPVFSSAARRRARLLWFSPGSGLWAPGPGRAAAPRALP